MSTEVQWGGRIDAITRSGNRCSGFVMGTFAGIVPDGLEGWVPTVVLGGVKKSLKSLNSAQDATADLAGFSALVSMTVHDELAEQGVAGTVTVTRAPLKELSAPAPSAVVAAPPAPVHSPPPVVPPQTPAGINETALATPALHVEALPFKPGTGQAPPPANLPPSEDAGETSFIDSIEGLDEIPDLTVEQYASLCVERTMNPAAARDIAQRYKILTEEGLRAVDERWRSRFAAQGDLHRRWQQAYAQYEAWLRQQQR